MTTDEVKEAIKQYHKKYSTYPSLDCLAKEIADTSKASCDEADLEDLLERLESVGDVHKDVDGKYVVT